VLRALTTLELDPPAWQALSDALAPAAELRLVEASPGLADADAEILITDDPPVSRIGLPRLRWLQLTTTGVDHLELDRSWDGVTITTASGLFTPSIAEFVIGSIFFCAQQVPERLARARARSWDDRWSLSGRPLAGTTIVLLGYGSIGREIARLASALRMRIVAVKARPEARAASGFSDPGTGDPDGSLPEQVVGIDRLAEVAAQADWFVISLPLTDDTRHLVDATVLAALRPDAWLVNVGRGAVVDEDALVDTLDRRAIAGAVLDVFAQEPLPPDHPLWSTPNTIVTPHISGALERWDTFAEIVAANVPRLLAGEPLLNAVDPARGY
jgi:phosphoglycerate dehydrogenase-like enzyme